MFPTEEGPFIPITSGPSGPHIDDDDHPPMHHHHPNQYYDFTGTAQHTGPNYLSSTGSGTAPDYEPARPPPPPPRPLSHELPEPQTSYGDPAYSFKGPLTIYYGFKPVATPYGNISLGKKEYGASYRRYGSTSSDGFQHPSPPSPPPVQEPNQQLISPPQSLSEIIHNELDNQHEIAPPQMMGVNVDVAIEHYDNPQYKQDLQQPNYYHDYSATPNNNDNNLNNAQTYNDNVNNNDYSTGSGNNNGVTTFPAAAAVVDEPSNLILPPPPETSDFPPAVSPTTAYYATGDYPDFTNDDQSSNAPQNVPTFSRSNFMFTDNVNNYNTNNDEDLDRNSYRNAQYRSKRDLGGEDDNEKNGRVVRENDLLIT